MKLDKNKYKIIFLYLSTVIIFILIFSKIGFFPVLKILRNTNLMLLSIALVFHFTNVVIRAAKFRQVINYMGLNLALKEAIFLEISSFPVRILFPMKSGELVQALYLKKKRNFPITKGVFSLIVNTICDFCGLLAYLFLGIILIRIDILKMNLLIISIIFLFLVTVLFLLIFKKKYFSKIYKYGVEMLHFLKRIQFKKVFILFSYSLIFHLVTFLTYFWVFRSLSITVPFKNILLFVPLLLILTQVPVTISGFGTREVLIIHFFSNYASQEMLLAVSILISFIVYFIPTILSLFLQKKLFEPFLR